MSDLFERVLLLKQSQVFSEVPSESLRVVAQMLEEEQHFSGSLVFTINEPGDCIYILQSGKIGISLNPDKDSGDYIAELDAGDCLGEINLLDELPRSASAHVLEDCQLLLLKKTQLQELILNHPELSTGLLKSMSKRIRSLV